MNDQTDEELSFVEVLDELEYYMANGRKLPFTGNVIVNEEDIVEFIDRIRRTLPEEIVTARSIVEERDDVVEAAHAEAEHHVDGAVQEAENILLRAKQHAEELVDSHEILVEARSRAASTISDAEHAARIVTEEADKYATTIMNTLEEQLSKTLTTVRRGLDSLPNGKKAKKGSSREA